MKKKFVILTSVVVLGIIGGIAVSTSPNHTKADDSPLVTQVDNQDKELKNHEARITNTENDVKDVQDKTNTPPSVLRVPVPNSSPTPIPLPSQPAPSPAPPSTPPTIVSFEQIPGQDGSAECKVTYSDGTTYQWQWKTIDPHGSWATDGSGQNGHWETTTNTSDKCDERVIGNTRP